MSVRDRITAELDKAEAMAKRADQTDFDRDPAGLWYEGGGVPFELFTVPLPAAHMEHIAANSPAHALRQIAHARDVLARHYPWEVNGHPRMCMGCIDNVGVIANRAPMPEPCAEVRSLAAAWGVPS